jgi:hypothetical protein
MPIKDYVYLELPTNFGGTMLKKNYIRGYVNKKKRLNTTVP